MKALSVKQPWANMIASRVKTIETRKWATPYKGPLVIVSSKIPKIEPAGCAVAIVTLKECRLMKQEDEQAACCPVYTGAFSWVLADIRKIRPIPVRGALGIFDCELEAKSIEFDEC